MLKEMTVNMTIEVVSKAIQKQMNTEWNVKEVG